MANGVRHIGVAPMEPPSPAGYTLPGNPEAEQSVLGAILVRPEVMDQVVDLLEPEDFYREAHGRIYRAMLDLYRRGEPVDLVTVTALLKERGHLEGAGGPVFLAGLSEQVGFATNAPHYGRLVWEKSQIRKIRTKAEIILQQNPNGDSADFFTFAESQILEVTGPALGRIYSFPPLDGAVIPLSECLKDPPPPRDYLIKGVLPAEIVGGMVAVGGTGKGHAIVMISLSLATGRKIGPLEPARKFKVLYLSGEDSQEELQRRTISAIEALWPDGPPPPEIDNFIPVSVMGKLGPLMQLDVAGNPVTAPAFGWVCKTLQNLPDVEVLVLDPKAKFYGLVENDNDHNAAWVNCLASLVDRFKVTALFSHHESKAKVGSMEQTSSRGGSALTDGCRWVANLKTMDPKMAEKFQVAEPHNYVVMDITKSNYAAKLPAPVYFRRGAGGALTYVDLNTERVRGLSDKLLSLLAQEEANGRHFSRRDLLYEKETKHIIDDIKEMVQGFTRVRDINLAVDYMLRAGWLEEVKVRGAKTGPEKAILRVIATAG